MALSRRQLRHGYDTFTTIWKPGFKGTRATLVLVKTPGAFFVLEGKTTDPLDAGVEAGIKAGQDVLKKAKKQAAKEAKKAAEKAVEEALKITELPVGNGKKPKAKYIEEVNITEVFEKMNLRVHPTLMQGISATGTY